MKNTMDEMWRVVHNLALKMSHTWKGIVTVGVYFLNGRVVANRNIEAGAPAECHFHFEQKGTYLVKLIGGGKAVKVIVE